MVGVQLAGTVLWTGACWFSTCHGIFEMLHLCTALIALKNRTLTLVEWQTWPSKQREQPHTCSTPVHRAVLLPAAGCQTHHKSIQNVVEGCTQNKKKTTQLLRPANGCSIVLKEETHLIVSCQCIAAKSCNIEFLLKINYVVWGGILMECYYFYQYMMQLIAVIL